MRSQMKEQKTEKKRRDLPRWKYQIKTADKSENAD